MTVVDIIFKYRHVDLREKFQGRKNVKNVERIFCDTLSGIKHFYLVYKCPDKTLHSRVIKKENEQIYFLL